MSLTGMPLVVLSVLGTIAALAATILFWDRGRRRRLPLRSLGVLITEALLLLSVGLVVNRSEQFYPSWSALLQTGSATGTAYVTAPGHLDRWLRAHAGPEESFAFTWQPAGWTGWHLAGAPTVVTPIGYLRHPTWRYSGLLVIDNGTGGWTPTTEAAAARAAGGTAGAAIMVFARTTRSTTAGALAAALPAALARDIRVTARRWALIASTTDAGLARQTVAAAPARYPAIVLVEGTRQQGPMSAKQRARTPAVPLGPLMPPTARNHPSQPTAKGLPVPRPLPAGIAVALVDATATAHHGAPGASTAAQAEARELEIQPVFLPAGATNALRTALVWACQQTPPPLAASTPAVTYVPIHRKPKHHAPHSPPRWASAGSPPATTDPGGSRAPGQPGH